LAADPSFDCSAVEAGSIEARICADEDLAEVERGDQVSLMYRLPSGSGARCVGRNETLWEHRGEALVSWGCGRPAMKCVKQ